MHELLTTEEAADYLRMNAHTLRVWRSRLRPGGPPFVKIGRRVRYRAASLAAWAAEHETQPVNATTLTSPKARQGRSS